MSKVRVYKLAGDLNMDQQRLVTLFQSLGYEDVRNHMSVVDAEMVDRVRRHLETDKSPEVVEERIRPTVVKRKKAGGPPVPARPVVAAPVRAAPPPPAPVAARAEPVPKTRKKVPAAPAPEARPEPKAEPRPVVDEQPPAAPVVAPEQATQEPEPEPVAPPPPAAEPAVVAEPQPEPLSEPEPAPVVAAVATAPEREPEVAEPTAPAAPAAASVQDQAPVASEPPPVEVRVEKEPEAQPQEVSGMPSVSEPTAEVASASPPAVPEAAAPPPAPRRERAAQAPARPAQRPAPAAPSRVPQQPQNTAAHPSQAPPRTGIETWAGRPGVPMRQPPQPRAPVPRRVQYDPRAVAAAAAKPDPRSGATSAAGRKPWGNKGGGRRGPTMGSHAMSMGRKAGAPSTKEMAEHKKIIKIEENISLQTLAGRMSLKATEVLMKLLSMGMPGVNINSTLDADTAKLVAGEFGWEVEDVAVSEEQAIDLARASEEQEEVGDTEPRPPIVTVMGHVDHGKTSLLDQIRKTKVAESEAGGITQHIGAYKVTTSRGPITFLDTPGHAAFTSMRARGAQVTDIVILVVAADDGVMPQTREAVNHARAARVPIIVAVNKIDKPGAQPERIRRELAEMNLVPEEWGGDTIFCDVSAKTRVGLEALLEMTALQSELLELRATPSKPALGTVIEALLDRGKGPVARVVVTDGTLRSGDVVLVGTSYGKIRAMTDDLGRQVAEAGPSTPVEILGLSEVPSAGDPVHVLKDVKKAQEIALARRSKASKSLIPASAKVSLEDLAKRMAEAEQLELRLIIKADVQGSVEAIADALAKLSTEKVRVAIIHAGVGGITEGDVNLAVASKAIIVGFSVRTAGKAGNLAENEGIEIRLYSVIYDAVDDVRKAMVGLLAPQIVERNLGRAEVRQTFHIAKIGTVAGCLVQEGTIRRNAKVRLVRDAVQVWEGRLSSLKRFKDDAREVDKGFECGIGLEGYNDVKTGDVIECFEQAEIQATL